MRRQFFASLGFPGCAREDLRVANMFRLSPPGGSGRSTRGIAAVLAAGLLIGVGILGLSTVSVAAIGPGPSSTPGPPPPLSIGGTVTGPGPVALQNISVLACPTGAGACSGASSATDGTYTLAGLAGGTYAVQFQDPTGAYAFGYYSTSGYTPDRNGASIVGPSSATGIDVQLPIGYSISGTVTDPLSTPLAGITVDACPVAGACTSPGTQTAADGTYTVSGLAAGSYEVTYLDPTDTYARGIYGTGGFTPHRSLATVLTVPDSTTGIDVQLPLGLSISGSVTDAGATGIAGISVSACPSDGLCGDATTASGGSYLVGGLAADAYTVAIDDSTGTYASGYYSTGGFDPTAGSPVTSGATGIDVVLPLVPPPPTPVPSLPPPLGVPTGVVAAAGDTIASVSWVAPVFDGGSPIASYEITPHDLTASVDGTPFSAGGTSATVPGLTNLDRYTFTVTATNAALSTSDRSAPSNQVTPQATLSVPTTVAQVLPPGTGTVTTDPDNLGPTSSAPVTAAVTVPDGGSVGIAVGGVTESAPTGFSFLGQQVVVSAPAAAVAAPLALTFTLDASLVGARDPATIKVYRTEGTGQPVEVLDCAGAPGTADPDPCVSDRSLVGGDLQITVLTSSASTWNLGVDTAPPTVNSIALAGPSPTNAPSVAWTVTFSEPVTGVGTTNFTLVRLGLGGSPVITGVTGSGAAWTVTASSGTGDWALEVNLTSRAGIADLAGNPLANKLAGKIYQVDRVAPTIALTKPASGAAYTLGATVNASFSCADELIGSGLASCTGTVPNGAAINTASVGSKTFALTALDRAGNSTTKTVSYTVIYPFSGFFGSVANPPTVNSIKAGPSVPVPFSLGAYRGPSILAAGSPTYQAMNCSTHALTGASAPATGAPSYSTSTGRYTYTWQTSPAWAGTCEQLSLVLNDGTSHLAYFRFTK